LQVGPGSVQSLKQVSDPNCGVYK